MKFNQSKSFETKLYISWKDNGLVIKFIIRISHDQMLNFQKFQKTYQNQF
jgi:hypothetical protein